MRRVVILASLIGGAAFAATMTVPDTTAPSALIAVHAEQSAVSPATPTIWQGIVVAVRPGEFDMTVDTVWSPKMAFDIGSRTVRVTTDTLFDPPVWNMGNLAVGEDVAVTVVDTTAPSPVARDVTVVDPD